MLAFVILFTNVGLDKWRLGLEIGLVSLLACLFIVAFIAFLLFLTLQLKRPVLTSVVTCLFCHLGDTGCILVALLLTTLFSSTFVEMLYYSVSLSTLASRDFSP